MDPFAAARPWAEVIADQVPGLELFDAHTHLGQNDPDGMEQTPQELLSVLEQAGARGAFVFPMHEPHGYAPANDMVIAAALRAGGGLVPFCRLDPEQDPVREAERCLDSGARDQAPPPRGGIQAGPSAAAQHRGAGR